jgi:hypothetical protein
VRHKLLGISQRKISRSKTVNSRGQFTHGLSDRPNPR